MQLRFIRPVFLSGVGLKQSLSAVLTGMTAVGTITAVALNIGNTRSNIVQYLEPLRKVLISDTLLGGINQLGARLHTWGSAIVGSKDALKEWIDKYLSPHGLKAGVASLYKKLIDWGTIVYEWFRDKFWTFITNIPDMVKRWDQLRLSLFKWGTFLGGGGGAALWSMFGGSFDNLGKLAELMGNPDFREAAEKFAELVDKNPEAFDDMNKEDMQEIFERIAEDPKEAKQIVEDLLKEQQDMAAKAKEEKEKKLKEIKEQKDEVEKEPQLKEEQVKESFKKGSPQTKGEVFGYLIGESLEPLIKLSFDISSESVKQNAKEAMQKYIEKIKKNINKETKLGKASKKFVEAIAGDKETKLVDTLADLASKAFAISERDFKQLSDAFEKLMEERFTRPMREGEEEEGQPVQIKGLTRKPSTKN